MQFADVIKYLNELKEKHGDGPVQRAVFFVPDEKSGGVMVYVAEDDDRTLQ